MARNEETNWLEDAFDESKAAQDLERAKRSRKIGYALVVVLVVIILLIGFSCSGIMGVLSAVS